MIGVMSKLKDTLPQNVLLLLYNSMILPYLSYCNIIWGSCNKYLLERILLLQKRAVRIICHKPFLSHSRPLFLKLKILPINLLYEFQLCVFMYSFYNNLLPKSFSNTFQCNSDVHHYNTRSASNIRAIYGRKSFSNSIFLCKGPLSWNRLPIEIKQCKTLSNFKRKLKSYLMLQI